MKMKDQRKGQVSLFIIIGLVVLITLALTIYLTQFKEAKPLERESIKPSLPTAEADPVSSFITSCLKITAINGLKLIGDQGGYITSAFSINPVEPTEAEAVQLGKNGLVIPYWWHMSSPNNCQSKCKFESKRPGLHSGDGTNIEDQLKEYIEQNIDECLNNFRPLEKQGYDIKAESDPEARVSIKENDILLNLNWKINAKKGEEQYDLSDFAARVDLNLKEIYDVATELTNLEINRALIDAAVKDLIYAFSARDKESLPPIADMTFDLGGGIYWTKTEVGRKLKQMLQAYIPALQATGTRNFHYAAAPAKVKHSDLFELMYNRGFLIPLEEPHPSLEVRFYYLNWWKPYFDLNCDGELCGPDNTGSFLIFSFAIQKYNFVYDLSLPVMVEITSPDAINGQGYSFKFMLEANIRNNELFTSNTTLPPVIDVGKDSIFCNPNQRTSGNVTLDVTDYATGERVKGATVLYSCGDETCMIGKTKNSEFRTKFPRCINGILTIKKRGYKTVSLPITMSGLGLKLQIKMFPEKELKVKGRKYLVTKQGGNWRPDTGSFYPVSENESLLVVFSEKKNLFSRPYNVIADLSKGQPTTIKLYPGDYKLTYTGFSTKEIVIPKNRRCTPPVKFIGVITVEDAHCFYAPEEDMVFNEENPLSTTIAEVEFRITPEQLYKSKEIILPYFSFALDKLPEEQRRIEDLEQIGRLKSYTRARENMMKPILR